MGFDEIRSLLVPLLLIGFGIFIKTTKSENFQDVKKWWKFLVIGGIILLILKTVNLFI